LAIYFTVGRVTVLELNVARLQKVLKGDTASERFSIFVERLQRPEVMLALLQEYPVLARRMIEIIDNWLSSSLEFVSHLFRAWNASRIQDADPGDVAEITGGMGDLHRGGRAVRQVTFSSGAILIYKPRSLSMGVHFQELLRWLNAKQPVVDPIICKRREQPARAHQSLKTACYTSLQNNQQVWNIFAQSIFMMILCSLKDYIHA